MEVLLKDKKILFFLIIFVVLFPLGFFGLRLQNPVPESITPATLQKADPSPTSATLPKSDPNKKLLDYIQNRRALSNADLRAKKAILSSAASSGVIYQNEKISIEYVKSADLFQVEIMTIETVSAKKEAVEWFQSKGLSNEGICSLPVSFYLNFDIKIQLEEAGSFNPLPDTC